MIDLDKLFDNVNLVDLAKIAGAILKQHHGEWRGCCPLHGGDNPTAFVIANGNGRQRYRCYTGCDDGYWHDGLDFVQQWRNCDFMGAVTYLADMSGIPLSDLGMTPERAQQITIQRKKNQQRQEMLSISASYYAAQLASSTDAMQYAQGRGWSDDTIKATLGYSDGNLLSHLRTVGADLNLAREAGVITQYADETLADAIPKGYLVYIHRLHDQVVYLSGRATFTNDQAKKSRNIKAPRQLFWATHRQQGPLIVIEGQPCAITVWQWGYNAVGLCGTNVTEKDAKLMASYPGVYLILDLDATYDKIKRAADQLGPLTMIVSGLPAHDVNDWLVKANGTRDEMDNLLERSRPWIEVAIDHAIDAPGYELEDQLDHLAQLVAGMSQAARGRYVREICDRKRLTTRTDFRRLVASYTNGDETGNGWEIADGKLTYYGEPLGNWHARITHELIQDDGLNPPAVLYTIAGGMDTGAQFEPVEVRAEDFDAMKWVGKHWGARPITYVAPGKVYQVRRCIQEASRHELKRERVYTFTGWKEIEGKRLFLTTTGGLGADGLDTTVRVDLGLNRLNHYALPDPPADLRPAIRASLDFLQLADYQVTVPILAAMYAAPLAPIRSLNAVLWVYGTTQSGKSTISHLALSHFGKTFISGHEYHAPADWTSTVTSLEGVMFSTKDTPVILDDYAPAHSGASEARRMARSAHYVVRSVGNRSGRGRARADLSEQTLRPPRGLVITTAENPLVGQSIVGRMIYVPVEPGQVIKANDDHKTESALDIAQQQAAAGMYGQAMAGYIRWLAQHWDTIADELPYRIESATRAARGFFPTGQSRLMDYYGLLTETLRLVIAYAHEHGAIEKHEADNNLLVAYQVQLVELLKSQGDRVASQSPVIKFWQAVNDMLAQKKVCFAPRRDTGFIPPDRADLIGWYDENNVYLLTNTALSLVKRYWESLDERFDALADALRRELWQQGYISERDKRNYERQTYINQNVGRTRSLWIDSNTLFDKTGIDLSGEREPDSGNNV